MKLTQQRLHWDQFAQAVGNKQELLAVEQELRHTHPEFFALAANWFEEARTRPNEQRPFPPLPSRATLGQTLPETVASRSGRGNYNWGWVVVLLIFGLFRLCASGVTKPTNSIDGIERNRMQSKPRVEPWDGTPPRRLEPWETPNFARPYDSSKTVDLLRYLEKAKDKNDPNNAGKMFVPPSARRD
jgi:hypothetical protein